MKQMQLTHGSGQWGGRASFLVLVLAGLWCATSAHAAEKVALGSSIHIELTIDGKAVPAGLIYNGPRGYEQSKVSTAIRLKRGEDYLFLVTYRQGGKIYRHLVSGTVDWAGLRRVSIAFSKIKRHVPLTCATVNGQVTIVGCDGSAKSVVIPKDIQGKRVTSIGGLAFSDCRRLTSVTIPDSVTSIGAWAFHDCRRLRSVTIPDSVTSIGGSAFYGTSLRSISIPKSVTSIGGSAFARCSALVGFIVARGNPAYVSREGVLLTKGGKALIRYPAGRKDASYTVPDGVTSIGDSAFRYCGGLTSVTIPDSVTSIGKRAFWGCGGLRSVTIPDSVTSIGSSAFSYCRGLTSMSISKSVTSIGDNPFARCSALVGFVVAPGNLAYVDREGVLLTKGGKKLLHYPAGRTDASYTIPSSVTSIGKSAFTHCQDLTSVVIPDSVTSIEASAFASCHALTSVTIPDSVTSIGDSAFEGCHGLTSMPIPKSVTSIGDRAFSRCRRLTSVTIPNSVTSIGPMAFAGCGRLTSVSIPKSVTSIGERAFFSCGAIVGFIVAPGNSAYISREGVLLTKDGKKLLRYPASRKGASYTIPDSVTSIGRTAFAGCRGLTSVTIPNSVTSIGTEAFMSCRALKSVTIPKGVKIGKYAFVACPWQPPSK